MPTLRPVDRSRALSGWTPRRRGEGNAGLVLGMVLIVVLCVVVIGGSLFFIFTNWPGDEEERQWEGGAPPAGVGAQAGVGPGAKPGGNAGARPNMPVDVGPPVGQTAPDILGEDIDGAKFKLSDYRGKVVMLDFWGHW